MADLCPTCGANPCYRICPTQDPYGGDQAAEAADHDFNAQYDDVRERYMEHCPRHGAYAGDCGGCEAEHYADEDDEPLDGNEDDYGDPPVMPASMQRAVIDNPHLMGKGLLTDDDVPF
jgi:hypothetical protein